MPGVSTGVRAVATGSMNKLRFYVQLPQQSMQKQGARLWVPTVEMSIPRLITTLQGSTAHGSPPSKPGGKRSDFGHGGIIPKGMPSCGNEVFQ